MLIYAEAWATLALVNGQYVHWIDGACRFNPERVMNCFPESTANANHLLHNLFVGRGFTVHQFAALIDRLANEVEITKAKLIIVDGPIVMHLDRQIIDFEARILLQRCMIKLQQMAQQYNIVVIVITSLTAHSKRHASLLKIVDKRCSQKLIGTFKKQSGTSKMWLVHQPSNSHGFSKIISAQKTLVKAVNVTSNQNLIQHDYDDLTM